AYIAARDELLVFGGIRQLNIAQPVVSCAVDYAGQCDGEDPRSDGGSGDVRCNCDFSTGWLLQPTGATTARWQRAAAASSVYSPTDDFSMAYDVSSHSTVIFRGRLGSGSDCDGSIDHDSSENCHSMWTWDGISVRPGRLTSTSNIADTSAC